MITTSQWRALALAAGIATPMWANAAEVAVDQHDMQFVPGAVTINAGDSVRFTDTDRIAHDITVVNPDGTAVDRGMDYYNQQIVVKFASPGAYLIRCRIHPTMKMTITVK
jgi:plastocyanin